MAHTSLSQSGSRKPLIVQSASAENYPKRESTHFETDPSGQRRAKATKQIRELLKTQWSNKCCGLNYLHAHHTHTKKRGCLKKAKEEGQKNKYQQCSERCCFVSFCRDSSMVKQATPRFGVLRACVAGSHRVIKDVHAMPRSYLSPNGERFKRS